MKRSIFTMINIGLLLLSSLIVMPVSSEDTISVSSGNTIYVDDDNTIGPWNGTEEHPYRYITDGIDAADNGDTVFVKNGVYTEEFEIFKEINLLGENRKETIIKPFLKSHDIINIYSDYVNVMEFQIQDASFAIRISANSITVEDNIFKNNICGICVKSFAHSNNFYNNIFLNNSWGILLNDAQDTTIINNNFTYNDVGIEIIGNNNNVESNIFFKNNYGIRIGNPLPDVSYANYIKYNNFILNKIPTYDYFNIHRFIKGFNKYYGNYWDIPRFFPKFIPKFSVDWHPALKPNNINVGGVD